MKIPDAIHSSPDLPFNPAILKWARERLFLEISVVAKKIQVKTDKLVEWETGTKVPTARQGRELARVYQRPFLEFFATKIPELPKIDLIPDYRLYRSFPKPTREFDLIKIQQWVEEIRLNALALLDELGESATQISNNLKFNLNDDVEASATIARELLKFDINEQTNLHNSNLETLPDILRNLIENIGIIILKNNNLRKQNVRGLCLFSNPIPTIVLGDESPSAQAFTLIHEFAHVLLEHSAVSGYNDSSLKIKQNTHPVESWCNQFAASFLIPEIQLANFIVKPNLPHQEIDLHELEILSNKFNVSQQAMLHRLIDLNYVERSYYWNTMRPIFIKQENKLSKIRKNSYYGKRHINRLGRFYTGLVLDAWNGGYITAHNAGEYMGITNLQQLLDIRSNL